MAYQGGDIKFTIVGNKKVDLDNNNFKVIVYPHCQCGKITDFNTLPAVTLNKDSFEKTSDNTFVGKIPYTITKDMEETMYSMEVLIIDDEKNERRLFVKKHAFSLECSVSKQVD